MGSLLNRVAEAAGIQIFSSPYPTRHLVPCENAKEIDRSVQIVYALPRFQWLALIKAAIKKRRWQDSQFCQSYQ